jgi:hypothetical protein
LFSESSEEEEGESQIVRNEKRRKFGKPLMQKVSMIISIYSRITVTFSSALPIDVPSFNHILGSNNELSKFV